MAAEKAERKKGKGRQAAGGEAGRTVLTFTVAECGEFHSMGEYHEGIRTLKEAASLYKKMLRKNRNGIPSIGVSLHMEGRPSRTDIQIDVLTGEGIDIGMVRLVPELDGNPEVQEAVKALMKMFPEKEVLEL